MEPNNLIVSRQPKTHLRFEPEIDNGTTYAVHFGKASLVTGREKMFRLVDAVSQASLSLSDLVRLLVEPDGDATVHYADQNELMAEVLRLVNARVLAVEPGKPESQAHHAAGTGA
jgi:hypothetical protein